MYLWAISQTPVIKRLFQYHGAEHKVISAFEAGEELTVKNVQKYTRLHYRAAALHDADHCSRRCRHSVVPWDTMTRRVIQRIALLPIVLGVSFEFLKLTNAMQRHAGTPFSRISRSVAAAFNDEGTY